MDPRGTDGRIYKEDHYSLLHTKYESFGSCGFGEEDFFMFFSMTPPGRGSVSPSHFYYGAAPCPFSPAPCPFSQCHALFSESTFCALHFGKKFVKIGQKIRKLQDFFYEICSNKFGKIYDHVFHSY